MLLHTCRLVFLLALFALAGCMTSKPEYVTTPYELEGFDWRAYAIHHGCYLPKKDHLDEVISPVPTVRVMPAYPFVLQRAGVEGSVDYVMVIDEQGYVADVTVVKSTHIGFNKVTIDAICKWRFIPGTVNGVPHKVTQRSTNTFGIHK